MNKTDAVLTIGSGLSQTSKMPCYSFNLSALHCKTGSKLAKIKGSVCYGCYALKGRYAQYKHPINMMPKTDKINHKLWVPSMVYLINHQGNQRDKKYFRWHDSGDIQSLEHLKKIVKVCELTPDVRHWLPTREYKIVRDFLHWESFPDNLTVRLSAHLIDEKAPKVIECQTSTVNKNKPALGVNCKAYRTNKDKKVLSDETFQALTKQEKSKQGFGNCGDCRLCWDKSIDNISYKYH